MWMISKKFWFKFNVKVICHYQTRTFVWVCELQKLLKEYKGICCLVSRIEDLKLYDCKELDSYIIITEKRTKKFQHYAMIDYAQEY